MRKIIHLIFLFSCIQMNAQELPEAPILNEEMIYKDTTVDVQAEFPNGIAACYAYFAKKITLPSVAGLVDKVVLTFIVERNGTLTDIHIIHDAGFGTGNQLATILENGPKWIPAIKDGVKVRVVQRLAIPIITLE